tara:strand:- start:1311 stop:1493 length:183 start_codon:yes stop_codon:yes gene_type:complete
MMTKSSDGCVVIVKSESKSDKTDIYLSKDTLRFNVENGKFVKHKTIKYNGNPVYVLKEDL